MWWDGHMGGWMWFGWIGGGLLVLAVLWLLLRAAQRQNPPASGAGRETPEDELKRRYARGEIDRTEFERKLEDLRK
jgi:putative membrane protein